MDSNRSETAEYIQLHTKYAETYLKNRDDLHILTDKVLEMYDGDLAQVKKSVSTIKQYSLPPRESSLRTGNSDWKMKRNSIRPASVMIGS